MGGNGEPTILPHAIVSVMTNDGAEVWSEGANDEAEDALIKQILAANAGEAVMDRLTPAQIRNAKATFAVTTTGSADGFYPRHFGWLSDAVLSCWAEIWALA